MTAVLLVPVCAGRLFRAVAHLVVRAWLGFQISHTSIDCGSRMETANMRPCLDRGTLQDVIDLMNIKEMEKWWREKME